jgi:uncharacterized protein
MSILQTIVDHIDKDAPVKEVRKGLFWTAVVSAHCGLASTMMKETCSEESEQNSIPPSYAGKSALELARLVFSDAISDASLGVAAINSLIDIDESRCIEINAEEFLSDHGRNKNVSVIGHFPFTETLRKVAKNLWVIEKWQRPGDFAEDDAEKFLPRSDIIAISSTTLINHTLPSLLNLCPARSIKMLLGPTTPMTDALFDCGIDVVCGSKITDEQAALKYISKGANFRQLKKTGAVKLLTMMTETITRHVREERK